MLLRIKLNKMAGHLDVFPVKSNKMVCEHYLLHMLQFMQLEKKNGQITVILSENILEQCINQEATYPPRFIEIGQKRNNNGL